MSAEQTIILTTLPQRIGATTAGTTELFLSVFISPRLMMPASETNDGVTTLDQFDKFTNWPQTLSQLHFKVNFDGHIIEEPNGVLRINVPEQSERWKALFPNPKLTLVRPYNFADDDMSGMIILSYPVMNVIEFIKDRYGNSGAKHAAPTRCSPQILPRIDHPSFAYLFGPEQFGPITAKSRAAARAKLDAQLQAKGVYIAGKTPDPPVDFLQVADFHPSWHYSQTTTDKPSSELDEDLTEPHKLDFHEMVSSLAEFPQVMRRVGLIVDLKITLNIAPQNMPASGQVGVSFANTNFKPKVVAPLTLYRFNAARNLFIAAPRETANADFTDGLLKLDEPEIYGIAQVDVDGAAIKGMNFVEQMIQASSNPSIDTPGKAPLPSLRSGGISLVRTNHAAELIKTFANAKDYNQRAEAGEEIKLAAEDVHNGYRVDVREVSANGKAGEWRSLCRRFGTYQFHNNSKLSFTFEDEGTASVGVTEQADPKQPGKKVKRVKLSEMLFRWAGWSLTVPKDVCSEDNLYGALGGKVMSTFGFNARFDLPSTSEPNTEDKRLPRLRFGNSYQLRVRTVDLAGNSLPPEDPAEMTTKTAVTYGRFEPVSWPTLILREAVSSAPDKDGKTVAIKGKEGESADRVVVRSELKTNFDSTKIKNDRHIVPVRISQEMAETHGMFDNAEGTGLNKACFEMIKEKQSMLPKVMPGAQITLPYFPDPMARGVTFLGLPGQDAVQVSYWPKGTKWPDLKPFRLEVVAVASKTPDAGVPTLTPLEPPVFSENNVERVLTVRLPQAEMATVRLSSYLSNEYGQSEVNDANKLRKKLGSVLNKLGVWHWVEEWIANHAANNAEAEAWKHIARLLVLSGLHPIFTPYRELLMVHAVKQPLLEPGAQKLLADKVTDPPFATFARLSGEITCDGKSTGKLDVMAEWREPRDDPREPQPHASPTQLKVEGMLPPIESSAHVFEVPINLPDFYINQQDLMQQQLLKHGEKLLGVMDLAHGIVTLTSKDLRHEFGDTKHRMVNYTAVATTRFREYFEPSNPQQPQAPPTPAERAEEQKNYARVSQPVTLRVLSSARPESPKVLYIIPAFRWERGPVESKRYGGGLRVYMERGWYSSGDREMLGVVLSAQAGAASMPQVLDDTDPLKPLVSQWGADPLRASAGTNGLLAPENFTNAVTSTRDDIEFKTTNLSLDELSSGANVSVAPHLVAYDAARRLWYCDIEIDPGNSYYPFVRLALARYQPNSVNGVHLSRVVLADFVQLAPGRTVSITPVTGAPLSRNITVTGPSYTHFKAVGNQKGVDTIIEGGTLMKVNVEIQIVANDLMWVAQKQEFILQRDTGQQAWTGQINLPALPGVPGAQPMRLVIREFEFLTGPQEKLEQKLKQRIVYADVINL